MAQAWGDLLVNLRVQLYRFVHYKLPYYFAPALPIAVFFVIFNFLSAESVKATLSAFVQSIPAVIALLFAVTFFSEERGQVARRQLEKYSGIGRNLAQKILHEYERMEELNWVAEGEIEIGISKRRPKIELLKLLQQKKASLEELLVKPDVNVMPGLFTWLGGAPFTKAFLESSGMERLWGEFHDIIESYIRPIHTEERARGKVFKASVFLGLITTIFSICMLATLSNISFYVRILADIAVCLGISSFLLFGLYVYDLLFTVYVRRPVFVVVSS